MTGWCNTFTFKQIFRIILRLGVFQRGRSTTPLWFFFKWPGSSKCEGVLQNGHCTMIFASDPNHPDVKVSCKEDGSIWFFASDHLDVKLSCKEKGSIWFFCKLSGSSGCKGVLQKGRLTMTFCKWSGPCKKDSLDWNLFIGPRSDHSLPMSVTNWTTTLLKLDVTTLLKELTLAD